MSKRKIINLIDGLYAKAKKDKWIKVYNKELDYFCWTKPSISKNIHLVKISREVLLYLNSRGTIEGMGVEYLKNNFVQHNPDYKDIPKLFTEKLDKGTFAIPKKKERLAMDKFENFTKELVSDIYKENLERNRTSDDIEELVSVAIKN